MVQPVFKLPSPDQMVPGSTLNGWSGLIFLIAGVSMEFIVTIDFIYNDRLVDTNCIDLQVMTTFMAPPPASTFLAFHPQDNNIIAIGMDDSAIHIYNVRVDEVEYLSLYLSSIPVPFRYLIQKRCFFPL